MHRIYNSIGFTKAYNFVLWFVFSAAMFGFCLARMMYLDFYGVFCSPGIRDANHAAPGQCYWYTTYNVYRVGMKLHLYTIIPAGALACMQFVPIIRHKLIFFHRINGYVAIWLSIIGVVGAIMIAPVAFGGDVAIRAAVGLLAIMFIGSLLLAYNYIKKLRIDQHRAWMLRAWFYGILLQRYPDCTLPDAWVLVKADFGGHGLENQTAALDASFGMAIWMAVAMHAIGVEFYLQLTPAETQRLRELSRQRQAKASGKAPTKRTIANKNRYHV